MIVHAWSTNTCVCGNSSDVLKPRDPSVTNTDEWPEFRISNATLTNSSNELASLLTAGEHNPLTLTGTLEPPSKGQAHLWCGPQKNVPKTSITLQVTEILNYSYGAYADGTIELWAAGKAGWFLIRPSKQYRPTYNEIIDAVKILFFIVDAYSTPRKSGKGKNATTLPDFTAQELFEDYAIRVMGVEKGAPEAAKKMYKHREFLLSIMIEGREGIAWSKNPLYAHLNRKFASEAKAIRQRRDNAVARAKDAEKIQKEVAQHVRQPSLDSISTTSSLKRKRGRPPKDSSSIASGSVDSSIIELKSPPPILNQTQKKQAPATTKAKPQSIRSTRSNPTPSTPEIGDSQLTTPARQESDSEASRTSRRKSALRLKPNKPTKGPPKTSRLPPRLSAAGEDEAVDDSEDELSSAGAVPVSAGQNKRKKGNSNDQTTQQLAKPSNRSSKRTNARPISRDKTRASETVDEGIDIPSSPESDALAGAEDGTPEDLAIRLSHKPDQLQGDVWVCALDGYVRCSDIVKRPRLSC